MSDSSKKDNARDGAHDKERRSPPERAGHVRPADPELTKWLEKLWTRGNPPDRLEVWWMLGVNKDLRRGLVFYENFRQDNSLNIEQCGRLAGEIMSAVQNWTDSKRRLCFFEVAITDYHQQTVPLSRPIGPLLPERAYAGVAPDGEPQGHDEDEDDGGTGIKPLTHKYLSKMMRFMHQRINQLDAVMGDFMQIQQSALQARDASNERLHVINAQLHDQKQSADDRATERTVWVRKEEAKVKALEGSLKVGTTLLYGWLGMPSEDEGGQSGRQGGQAAETPSGQLYPVSMEQRHVTEFLEEAAEEKLSIQLFGDWKSTDNLTLQQVFAGFGLETPGIFSAQQFGILLAVRARLLPPEALDPLLADSGLPQAISTEQTLKAAPLMTQHMMLLLGQIRQLRLAAREKREARGEQPPQQNGAQSP